MISDFLKTIAQNPLKLVGGPLAGIAQTLQGVDKNYSIFNDFSGLVDSVAGQGTADSLLNQYTKAGPTGEQKWLANREDTAYQRATADMQAAGLNPAMMYGNGQASSSSVGQVGSPAVSLSDMFELAAIPAKIAQLQASAEDLSASAAEKRSNISLNEQLLEFNKDIQPLKIEAQKVANSIGRATEKKIYVEMDKMSVEMKKIAEEAETEEAKQLYYKAAADLDEAKAWQIIEMTPYSIELTKAQTSQARAIARLNFVQAAYQNKLLTEGFVDALIDSQVSGAEVSKVKARIKSGRAFQIDEPDKFIEKAWNAFAEASGISRGIQVIDYLLDKINLFAPLVSKGSGTAVGMSAAADPFGYLAGE